MKTIFGIFLVAAASTCSAEVFKSQAECVVGKRVADKADKVGTVVRAPRNETLCFVHLDGTAKDREETYIFWMLRAAGVSVETDDKLVPGVYECFAGLSYTFMDLTIEGAGTYDWAGSRGKYNVEQPSRRIVFTSGPLRKYTAKLPRGPSVGLNTDGGTFFGTHCDWAKK